MDRVFSFFLPLVTDGFVAVSALRRLFLFKSNNNHVVHLREVSASLGLYGCSPSPPHTLFSLFVRATDITLFSSMRLLRSTFRSTASGGRWEGRGLGWW